MRRTASSSTSNESFPTGPPNTPLAFTAVYNSTSAIGNATSDCGLQKVRGASARKMMPPRQDWVSASTQSLSHHPNPQRRQWDCAHEMVHAPVMTSQVPARHNTHTHRRFGFIKWTFTVNLQLRSSPLQANTSAS